jgi:hypothetical protein
MSIDKALQIAYDYGQIDGNRHKTWVIDQMLKSLLDAKEYKTWVKKYENDGEYKWDIGIPP